MANFIIVGNVTYTTRRILQELKELRPNDNVGIVKPSNLFPRIGGYGLSPRIDARFDDTHLRNDSKGITYDNLKHVSCIIPRIGGSVPYNSKIINQFQLMGVPTTSDAQGLLNAHDKLLTFQRIQSASANLPKTYAINSKSCDKEYPKLIRYIYDRLVKTEDFGAFTKQTSIVCKTSKGSQGKGVFLFDDFLDLSIGAKELLDDGHDILLQEMIETGAKNHLGKTLVPRSDYRVVVIDGEVVATIKRIAPEDDFRTNASQNGRCEGVVLDKYYNNIAIDIANKAGLRCAGIDLAFEYKDSLFGGKKGDAYCYEINGNFNFEATEEYSNINVAKKIAEYAIRIHKTVTEKEKFDTNVFEQTDGIRFHNRNHKIYKENVDEYNDDRIEMNERSFFGFNRSKMDVAKIQYARFQHELATARYPFVI